MFTLEPATRADLEQTGGVLEFRARAVTVREGDKIIAVGGFGYLDGGEVIGFARLTDEARRRKVSLCKAAINLMQDARKRGIRRVIARADPNVPQAAQWLTWLGFEPDEINGQAVYIWLNDNVA